MLRSTDSEKDIFYRTLADTFDELPRHDIKLLLGDFNAKITSAPDRHGCEAVIGGQSLHSSSNDNGTRPVDFCAADQLVIAGTLFQRYPLGYMAVAQWAHSESD